MQNLPKSLIGMLCLFSTLLTLPSCKMPKAGDARTMEMEGGVRARKNVEEGKGFSLRKAVGGRGATNYEFSTSNPLWRATFDVIDFMPLVTVDYSGGMIISEWYSDDDKESVKITLRFLANEVRSDSIKVIVHKKNCPSQQNCRVTLLKNSKINEELW